MLVFDDAEKATSGYFFDITNSVLQARISAAYLLFFILIVVARITNGKKWKVKLVENYKNFFA